MIPHENYSRSLNYAIISSTQETKPQLAQFLQSFHSNYQNPSNSEDEDEDLKQLGIDTVLKAYELLESSAWKTEKVTSSNDIIYTAERSLGKVYKLRAKVNYPSAKLLYELFYKIEDFPKWNPTLLESKILKKIDSNTDVAYSVSTSGGGGLVKSRDFVNLRCWKLMNDSRVIENFNIASALAGNSNEFLSTEKVNANPEAANENYACLHSAGEESYDKMKNVFVSAAMSIDYANLPPTAKFIRGENKISCWACRPVQDEDNSCYFEWLLCIDLKGSLPKYVLNTAYNHLFQDFSKHLRSRIRDLNEIDDSKKPNCSDKFVL